MRKKSNKNESIDSKVQFQIIKKTIAWFVQKEEKMKPADKVKQGKESECV